MSEFALREAKREEQEGGRTEHVERLEVHQTRDQVKPVGSSERDDDISESRVSSDQFTGTGTKGSAAARTGFEKEVSGSQYVRPPSSGLGNRRVDRPSSTVEKHELKDGEENHRAGEED